MCLLRGTDWVSGSLCIILVILTLQGRAMAHAFYRWPLIAEARLRSLASPSDVWWIKRHWEKFLSQHFSFHCQYHSTNAPYSFNHLPPMLYKVFLPVIQFPCQYHSTNAPYTFIHLPPTLYNCIKFFSRYSRFSSQYHSTNAPYSFIHSSTTDAV